MENICLVEFQIETINIALRSTTDTSTIMDLQQRMITMQKQLLAHYSNNKNKDKDKCQPYLDATSTITTTTTVGAGRRPEL